MPSKATASKAIGNKKTAGGGTSKSSGNKKTATSRSAGSSGSKSTKSAGSWHDKAPKGDAERRIMFKDCGQKCFLLPPEHVCNRNGCHEHYRYPICERNSCTPSYEGEQAAKSRARLVIAKEKLHHQPKSKIEAHEQAEAKANSKLSGKLSSGKRVRDSAKY